MLLRFFLQALDFDGDQNPDVAVSGPDVDLRFYDPVVGQHNGQYPFRAFAMASAKFFDERFEHVVMIGTSSVYGADNLLVRKHESVLAATVHWSRHTCVGRGNVLAPQYYISPK